MATGSLSRRGRCRAARFLQPLVYEPPGPFGLGPTSSVMTMIASNPQVSADLAEEIAGDAAGARGRRPRRHAPGPDRADRPPAGPDGLRGHRDGGRRDRGRGRMPAGRGGDRRVAPRHERHRASPGGSTTAGRPAVVVISSHPATRFEQAALDAGAHAYLVKREAAVRLIQALRATVSADRGGVLDSPPMIARVLTDDERRLVAEERQALADLRAALADLDASREDLASLDRSLGQLDELFLLVVVGEFNAGKSAFVNALLGRRLLDEGVTPTTAGIHLVRHGEETTEHPARRTFEEVTAPVELLREVNLVDTPGTNAIQREHEALTRDFIPRSDLVLFVTSADRPFTESERSFLETIRDWGKKIVVAVNKIDILESAEDVERVVAFVSEGVRELLGREPEVFPVSARQALKAKLAEPDAATPPRRRRGGRGCARRAASRRSSATSPTILDEHERAAPEAAQPARCRPAPRGPLPRGGRGAPGAAGRRRRRARRHRAPARRLPRGHGARPPVPPGRRRQHPPRLPEPGRRVLRRDPAGRPDLRPAQQAAHAAGVRAEGGRRHAAADRASGSPS